MDFSVRKCRRCLTRSSLGRQKPESTRRGNKVSTHDPLGQIRGTAAEKVLLNAYAAGGACPKSVYGAGLAELTALDGAEKLRKLGLAVDEASAQGELDLTELGVQAAEMVGRSHHDGPARWDVVQRAVLVFVRDTKPAQASDLVGSGAGLVDGRPVSKDDVAQAFEFLQENGLLTSIESYGAPDIRPEITQKGQYAIHEPNIREYVERGFVSVANDYSTNTTVSGGTLGAVTGGAGNTTNVTQTISTSERTQILSLVDQVLDGLPESNKDTTLRSKMQELKTEVANPAASRPGLLARAGEALVLAAMTAAGGPVIEGISQIVRGLGG